MASTFSAIKTAGIATARTERRKEGQLTPIGWPLGVVKNWTLEQFISTMRTGVDPNGYRLSANMPWRAIGRLDDIELEAMYLYLTSLP